jgi:curved DNA-binding protein CbpA
MTDYYKVLEISPSASSDEIKKAYRRLALKYHPDRNDGDKTYELKFKTITEAYSILSDIVQKENYDKRYENHRANSENERASTTFEPEIEVPIKFLQKFIDLTKQVSGLEKSQINQSALFNRLKELLSDGNIKYLLP